MGKKEPRIVRHAIRVVLPEPLSRGKECCARIEAARAQ